MAPVAPPATKLLFDVRVQPDHTPPVPTDPPIIGVLDPKLHKAPLARYGLLYMLPQDRIAFSVAGNGSYTGALEFDITAFDSNGTLVTSRSQTLNISLTSDEYKQFIQKPFQFLQQIDLPPGQLRVRAGVRDTVSNKVGTIDVPLEIAKAIPSKNTASAK